MKISQILATASAICLYALGVTSTHARASISMVAPASLLTEFLFILVQSDLVFPPEMSQKAAAKLRGLGKSADVFVIEGDGGHLDGVLAINKAAEVIRAFLAK